MKNNILISLQTKFAIATSKSAIYRFVQTFSGSCLIALGAQIIVPFYPVPMTLQTLSIALISLLMPFQVAIGSVGLYISYAAIGIPVLAGGSKGIERVLFGPGAGYIIGFLFMSGVISLLMKHYPTSGTLKRFLFTILGDSIVFVLGIVHLRHLFGWEIAIKTGLLPFVLSEPVKLAVATYLSVSMQGTYLKKDI